MTADSHPRPAYGVVDVHYLPDGGARAALVVAEDARFAAITGEFVARVDQVSTYRPGHFSERELPAVQVVLAGRVPRLLVIDGYVDLDPQGRPGLGHGGTVPTTRCAAAGRCPRPRPFGSLISAQRSRIVRVRRRPQLGRPSWARTGAGDHH